MELNKVIITGGLGFLGSHLAEILIKMNCEVIIVDDCSTNTVLPSFFSYANKCTVITSTVKDFNFDEILNVDAIFHLASIVGPKAVLDHAGYMGFEIISDTTKMIQYSIKHNILLVDISTGEVYGQNGVLNEESERIFGEYEIRTEYAAAKMLAEIMLTNIARVQPFKFHIIRPFNITGPRQKPDAGFVLPRFSIAVLTGQPLTIFGDGTQIRAFTEVNEVAQGIIKIAESNHYNNIWNIGNTDNQTNINQLAEKVNLIAKRKFNMTSNIIYVDPKTIHGQLFAETRVSDKIPDATKAYNLVGWKAIKNVDEIVEEAVDYYYNKIFNNGYLFKVI